MGDLPFFRDAVVKVDEYTLERDTSSSDYAAVYHLTKNGEQVGADINIPKDMVVSSGEVVVDPEGLPAGTYIKLVLANAASDEIYIDVNSLVEYVTSGSQPGDTVVIAISQDKKITATITDGTISLAKLTSELQTKIAGYDTHLSANATDNDGAHNLRVKDGVVEVKSGNTWTKMNLDGFPL